MAAGDTPDHRGAQSGEMARWQGRVDTRLEEHDRRLTIINGDSAEARRLAEEIQRDIAHTHSQIMAEVAALRSETRVEIATLRVKVALGATVGGLFGAGLVSGLITLFTHALGAG
jgi:hypothetical protein